MKLKKSTTHKLMFSSEEIKDALVFWLTRSPKNNSETCQLASYMNNSACKIHMPKNKDLTVTFTWDDDLEET